MKIIIPPPFLFLSNLYDLEKPSKTDISKKFYQVLFKLQQECIDISTVSFNCSNLFLIKFI